MEYVNMWQIKFRPLLLTDKQEEWRACVCVCVCACGGGACVCAVKIKNYQNLLQEPEQETKSQFTLMTEKTNSSPLSGKACTLKVWKKWGKSGCTRTAYSFLTASALFIRNLSRHARWLTSIATHRFYNISKSKKTSTMMAEPVVVYLLWQGAGTPCSHTTIFGC